MSLEQQDAREDDWDEELDYAPRSIFATGWFRAVLVLTALAVALVVALPYLIELFEPAPTVVKIPPAAPVSKVAGRTDTPAPSADAGSPAPPAAPTASTVTPVVPVAPPRALASPPAQERPRVSAPATPPARAAENEAVPRADRVAVAAAPPKPAAPRATESGRYWVQLGVFKDAGNADLLAQRAREQGFPVEVTRVTRSGGGSLPAGVYHLVRAGGFRDQPQALAANRALRDKGFTGFLTEGAAQ
jgi:cell division septation protein DedD